MARLKDIGYNEIWTTKKEAVKRKNLLSTSARKDNLNLVHSVRKRKNGTWMLIIRSKRRNK